MTFPESPDTGYPDAVPSTGDTHVSPGPYQEQALNTLFNEVVAWSQALAPLRQIAPAA